MLTVTIIYREVSKKSVSYLGDFDIYRFTR